MARFLCDGVTEMSAIKLSLLLFFICSPIVSGGNVQGAALNNTLTLAYAIPWSHEWEIGPYMGSALVVGIQEIKKRQLLPGYLIEFVLRDTYCKPQRGLQVIVEMWDSVADLDAIIGAGCSGVCQPESILAAGWGIPVVSYSCASLYLSDKSVYPTFSRVVAPWATFAPMFNAFTDQFNWKRVGIVTTNEDTMKQTAQATKAFMEANNKTVFYHLMETVVNGKDVNLENLQKQRQIVRDLKTEARIIFIITYSNDVRFFLISAYDEGMLNGSFIFIGIDVAYLKDAHFDYRPEMDKFIYTGLVTCQYRKNYGPEYDVFARSVIEAFQHPAFDTFPHLPLDAKTQEVEVHAGMVHDAVLLWAYGVNKTLEEGYPPDDGFRITQNIFNLSFEGITGEVKVDAIGNRRPHLRLEVIQGDELLPILDWFATDQVMVKLYKPEDPDDWSGIVWHGNSTQIMSDTPPCGWQNELCIQDSQHPQPSPMVIFLITASILVVFLLSVITAVRKLVYEMKIKEIESMTISWGDICLSDSNGNTFMQGDFDNNPVCIEMIDFDIDIMKRNTRVQVIEMMGFKHENVNNFLGVINNGQHRCIVMDFAQHGSLFDILLNSDFILTQEFKLSFLIDIVCGMCFLNQSVLGYHGRLSSKVCVIDSRWTCKITGYGFPDERLKTVTELNPDDLLWTAPEILRLNGNSALVKTDRLAADIYSFSIIMQELLLEDRPYAMNQPILQSEEIISKLRITTTEPFRPHIPLSYYPNCAWRELVESCWNEDPLKRPSFGQILAKLIRFNSGKDVSIVDKMIQRLEKYTRRLEERVIEKTQQFQYEKNRMEMLLSDLLPASAAQRLLVGETVEPEVFDMVTIFFSDLVGFTKISAQTSPMDIVMMLNQMYTLFDDVVNMYDVYKVATIGDAYLVASGVPSRNDDRHALEICTMAIQLASLLNNLPIANIPQGQLRMRIGIHSGPCVAGVTGVKMPRYLLFGRTVDIAANLESGGEAMKIHVSQPTVRLIPNTCCHFSFEERGRFHLKDKQTLITYWLRTE